MIENENVKPEVAKPKVKSEPVPLEVWETLRNNKVHKAITANARLLRAEMNTLRIQGATQEFIRQAFKDFGNLEDFVLGREG